MVRRNLEQMWLSGIILRVLSCHGWSLLLLLRANYTQHQLEKWNVFIHFDATKKQLHHAKRQITRTVSLNSLIHNASMGHTSKLTLAVTATIVHRNGISLHRKFCIDIFMECMVGHRGNAKSNSVVRVILCPDRHEFPPTLPMELTGTQQIQNLSRLCAFQEPWTHGLSKSVMRI